MNPSISAKQAGLRHELLQVREQLEIVASRWGTLSPQSLPLQEKFLTLWRRLCQTRHPSEFLPDFRMPSGVSGE